MGGLTEEFLVNCSFKPAGSDVTSGGAVNAPQTVSSQASVLRSGVSADGGAFQSEGVG